jgi:glycosyltransferase involved in cell wall biosynthesis
MFEISVIIPTYNESENIIGLIDEVQSQLEGYDYEIIVVDDGSDDKTSEIAKEHNCHVLKHEQNRGYGASLKSGIRLAKSDYIAITDADGTYPNERLPELMSYLPEYDMIVGARIGANTHIPLIRRPAKWVLGLLANYLTGTKIPDLNSGLRVFKKELHEKYWGIFPNGFSFTTTITMASLCNNFLVKYIPIDYYKREGKSKIRPIADTIGFFSLVMRTILYFNPLKVFLHLSILIFLLGMSVLLYTSLILGRVMDITSIVILLSSMQILAIGMIADVVVKRSGFK